MSDNHQAIKSWPPPGQDAMAHSRIVLRHIRQEIDECGGAISFRRYMELALYAPGLGYYSAGARKFGADGDFVTAPEVSPLYSRCLAFQCAEVLAALGGGDILEVGAGSGVMAGEVLRTLERKGSLPNRYLILELSADLRQRQRAALQAAVPHLLERVVWLDAHPEYPLTGIIIGNEFLDALPVHRFQLVGGEVRAMRVKCSGDGFKGVYERADEYICEIVERLQEELGCRLPDGYASEISDQLSPTVQELGKSLARGVVLFVDYGLPQSELYASDRNCGTLVCHYRHRVHDDPFLYPGLQDLTAWVNFTQAAAAGLEAGLSIAGFTPQAQFLLATGLIQQLDVSSSLQEQLELARQAKLLTLPGEMGERFKVLAMQRDYPAGLSGFALKDLSATL